MANPLAKPLFTAGAKDVLAAVDVYKKSDGKQVINSIQSLAQRAGLDVNKLLGGKLSTSSLDKILTNIGGKLGIDKNALQARLLEGSASLKNSFRQLTDSTKDMMYESFEDLGNITAKINGVQTLVSSADFTELASFGKFVNEYTNNTAMFSFEDLDGMGATISSMVTQGSGLGFDNMFSTLTETIDNPELMCRVVKQTVPNVLKNGDFKTLLDITSSRAGKNIGDLFPNFTSLLTQDYSNKYNGRSSDSPLNYDRLISSLFNVDQQWDVLTRGEDGDDLGINLIKLMGGSRDFKYLMETAVTQLTDNDDRKKYHMLGNAYTQTTVEALVARYFPRVYMTTPRTERAGQGGNNQIIDARS